MRRFLVGLLASVLLGAGGAALPLETVVQNVPEPHETVVVGGMRLYYHGGAFYRPAHGAFVVVAPPAGTAVRSLPAGRTALSVGGVTYQYFEGIFYRDGPLGFYVVAEAPTGAVIPALPSGATSVHVGDELHFEFGGVYYRPRAHRNHVEYVVARPFGLSTTGEIERAGVHEVCSFGIEGRFLTREAVALLMNLDADGGVLIERIVPGSPAERGGLRGGFLQARIDGRPWLLGGDLILGIEAPELCHGECLADIPELLAHRGAVAVVYLRGGHPAKTVIECSPFEDPYVLERD